MQVLDDKKKLTILKAAAELFAIHPFHKVKLSDVAERAAVGKGTVYTYFKSKEDLYLSMFYIGFSELVENLENRINLNQHTPEENIGVVISEIVKFAFKNPHLFEIMRSHGAQCHGDRFEKWQEKRAELKKIVEAILRQGVALGVFQDPNPELTAWIIPGIIRSVMLGGSEKFNREELIEHILNFVINALKKS